MLNDLTKPDCSEIFYIQNTIKRDREVMGAEYSLDWQQRKTITQLRGGEQKRRIFIRDSLR